MKITVICMDVTSIDPNICKALHTYLLQTFGRGKMVQMGHFTANIFLKTFLMAEVLSTRQTSAIYIKKYGMAEDRALDKTSATEHIFKKKS